MTENKFREIVLKNCNHICENPNCDSEAVVVHHFYHRSRFPRYSVDPDNGMGCCGNCHNEIERRLINNKPFEVLYPLDRFRNIIRKILNEDYWLMINIKRSDSIWNEGIQWVGVDKSNRPIRIRYNYGSITLFIDDQEIFELPTYTNNGSILDREIYKVLNNVGVICYG